MYLVLTRREGVQNPKNLADVICERHLTVTLFGKVGLAITVTVSRLSL